MRVIYSLVVSWKIQVRGSIEKLKALIFVRRYASLCVYQTVAPNI